MSIVGKATAISYKSKAEEYEDQKQIEGESVAVRFETYALSGQTTTELIREMDNWKHLTGHGDIKNDALWLSFSPSKEVIEQLGNDKMKWKELHDAWLHELGLQNSQRITTMHLGAENDQERAHLHDLINRIDLDGNVISDHMIGRRAKAASEKVSRLYGLKTAEEIGKEQRSVMKQKANEALKSLNSWSFHDFQKACEQRGVKVEPYFFHSKQGETDQLQGYFFLMQGHRIKASEVDRNLTLSKIKKQYYKLQKEKENEQRKIKQQQEQRRNRGRGFRL